MKTTKEKRTLWRARYYTRDMRGETSDNPVVDLIDDVDELEAELASARAMIENLAAGADPGNGWDWLTEHPE